MYRRPKFLEILVEIREQMSRDSDFDSDLFAEMVRSGRISQVQNRFSLKGKKEANQKKPKNKKSKN